MNWIVEATGQLEKDNFEIEPLEDRIAPSAMGSFTDSQGPWVENGGQLVFLGHDPA